MNLFMNLFNLFAQLLALTYRYLCQKWSKCHKTKRKHINSTLGLKCLHLVWPWPWPRPWIFMVKYGISYISAKKVNIPIEPKSTNVDIGFDLGHDLDLEFSRSNMKLAISKPKMVWVTSYVGVLSTHLVSSHTLKFTLSTYPYWNKS